MNKRFIITIGILILLVVVTVFLYLQNNKEIKTIQNDTEALSNTDVEEEQDKKIQNTEIIYNEDGDIDTSNWNQYEVGAISIKHPKNWYYYEYNTITNMYYENILSSELQKGEVRISMVGQPINLFEIKNISRYIDNIFQKFIDKSDVVCKVLNNTENYKLAKCISNNKRSISYLKIKKVSNTYTEDLLAIQSFDETAMRQNELLVNTIVNSYYLFSEKFIPSI